MAGTKIALSAALAAVSVFAIAAPNAAHAGDLKVFDTKVTLQYLPDESTFLGHVKSDSKRCKRNRNVRLLKQDGTGAGTPTASSNKNGIFSFALAPTPGKFMAKAQTAVFHRANGDTIRCRPDFSPLVKAQA